jgi:hypothetical protein
MSYYEVKAVDPDQLEALIREAQAERDRQLKALIVRGAKAVAKFFRTVAAAMAEAYEAERRRTAANARSTLRQYGTGD